MFRSRAPLLLLFAAGRTPPLRQGKNAQSDYLAGASKTGSEEKWAHAAMEYIYEKNHVNDSRKRAADVAHEKRMAAAFDRYCAVSDARFAARMGRLIDRMSESLEAIRDLGLVQCLEEAVVLNSEQPPGNYRRPTLTPPVQGYEPGFGFDVPQLKSQQSEYPLVVRPTDHLQFSPAGIAASGGGIAFSEEEDNNESSGGSGVDATVPSDEPQSYFPYVDAHFIEDLAKSCAVELADMHGAVREAAPLTGAEGEGWEAYVALQGKALARQSLIFELCNDPEFEKAYVDGGEGFRAAEWARRGILPLVVEGEGEGHAAAAAWGEERWVERSAPPGDHYAQTPAYQPFRAS